MNIGLSHNDLKLDNVMILRDDKDFSHAKLIDFGVSTQLKGKKLDEIAGTCYNMAPEVLEGSYDEKADIWSFGAMIYWLIKGGIPFAYNSEKVEWIFFERELRPMPKRISPQMGQFVFSVMERDP